MNKKNKIEEKSAFYVQKNAKFSIIESKLFMLFCSQKFQKKNSFFYIEMFNFNYIISKFEFDWNLNMLL